MERKGKAGSKNRRKLEGYLSPEATVKGNISCHTGKQGCHNHGGGGHSRKHKRQASHICHSLCG